MVRFLLIDRPSAYNAIVRRATLNELRAVMSTLHLKMKFPTDPGVEEVKGDQRVARQCYNISMKESPKTPMHANDSKEDKEIKWQ